MIKHTVKKGEDLGSIARAYGLVSWKYLHEKNKTAIGDNPDLLKPGTELEIPAWDSTSGDEKLKAKGIEPEQWTGSAGWRYPWVALSVSFLNNNEPYKFDKEEEVVIRMNQTDKEVTRIKIRSWDEFNALAPDSDDIKVEIAGYFLKR